MRNPDRIPKILKLLEEIWKKQPDVRLGQLISTITTKKSPGYSIWFIEDDDVLEILKNWNK